MKDIMKLLSLLIFLLVYSSKIHHIYHVYILMNKKKINFENPDAAVHDDKRIISNNEAIPVEEDENTFHVLPASKKILAYFPKIEFNASLEWSTNVELELITI